MPAISERSRLILWSVTAGSSIGSHWYAVPGLGMSGFTLPTILPICPRGRAYFSMMSRNCTVRSRMATRSSSVSVGRPIMKYSFRFSIPFLKIRSARSRISSFVTVLLMTRRIRSDPASGAMVMLRSPLCTEHLDDRIGQIVQPQRGRADLVTQVEQPRKNSLDLRVIAQRNGHEPGARGMRTGLTRQFAGCGRPETIGQAGSCSRPSRSGTGSRTRAPLRPGNAIRIPCPA